MVHHKLAAASEYNLRRADCERGVALLTALLPGVKALRDVSMAELVAHEATMPELTFRRCRHVVAEDDRVLHAAACLEAGEVVEFGRLMNQSHRSLRDDYEVSCHELDLLVEIACGLPGVLGSRMTGGGFGGCTVSLVRADAVDGVTLGLRTGYTAATGLVPEIFVCSPGDGVSAVVEETSTP
jgi:galactokinase